MPWATEKLARARGTRPPQTSKRLFSLALHHHMAMAVHRADAGRIKRLLRLFPELHALHMKEVPTHNFGRDEPRGWLNRITRLKASGGNASQPQQINLVELAWACPQLRQLHLSYCNLPQPHSMCQLVHLQQLALYDCTADWQALGHALAALPRLHTLRISSVEDNVESVLAAQLPALTDLVMHSDVSDAGLEALLQHVPNLRHLTVRGFELQNDHSQHSCSWERVSVGQTDVATLVHLPRAAYTFGVVFGVVEESHASLFLPDTGNLSSDLQLIQQAAQLYMGRVWVEEDYNAFSLAAPDSTIESVGLVEAALPLARDVAFVCLFGVHIAEGFLQAAATHLLGTLRLYDCEFAPGMCERLVTLLPAVQHLELSEFPAEEVSLICVAAARCVQLTWMQLPEANANIVPSHLQNLLQSMGRDFVSLTVLP